jgi:hypothetical protein
MFINPDNFNEYPSDDFIDDNTDLLQLPAGTSDKNLSLLYWRQYSKKQQAYLRNKLSYIENIIVKPEQLNLDLIWSGKEDKSENVNANATLTVFRHFDSASVLKGFIGQPPKTAWLISYPLLERIHYLLVAGFDVYGNVSHQLKTRLYMDFLRMEAESNFISFLPKSQRKRVHEHWYRNTNNEVKDYIFSDNFHQLPESGITYKTLEPQKELFQMVAKYTNNSAVSDKYNLKKPTGNDNSSLLSINNKQDEYVSILPQVSIILVSGKTSESVYSLINNSAHSNVAHLFSESDRRLPNEDTLTLLNGIVGTYPNALFHVKEADLATFSEALTQLRTEEDYTSFKNKFAIRRTNKEFWKYADKLHLWYQKNQPNTAGLLDFNRLENR